MKRLIASKTFLIGNTSFRVDTVYNPDAAREPIGIKHLKVHNEVRFKNIRTKKAVSKN